MRKRICKNNIRKTTNLSTCFRDDENQHFGIFYSSSRLNCFDDIKILSSRYSLWQTQGTVILLLQKLYLQTVYEIVSESSLRRSSLRFLSFNNNWPAFYETSLTPCSLKNINARPPITSTTFPDQLMCNDKNGKTIRESMCE